MNNNSSRSRFSKVTARLLMALLAVCLVLTAAPAVAPSALPVANAETVTYQVTAGTSLAAINSQLSGYASGTVVNMTLGGDLDFTGTGGTSTSILTGITIPEGITVNLYMNGKTIGFDLESGGYWQVPGVYAIVNNGTLNIYSGNASRPDLASGSANIKVINKRTGMSTPEKSHDDAYADLAAIKNSGTLSVNKNVSLTVNTTLTYDDSGDSAHRSIVSSGATGVYNTANSASVVLNSVAVDVYSKAFCANANYNLFTTQRCGAARAFAYGVYGGHITVNGGCTFNTVADMGATDDGDFVADFGRGLCVGIAYGLCSSQQISVNGGNFTYGSTATAAHDGMKKGLTRAFMGGIAYSSTVPVLTDGSISTFSSSVDQIGASDDTVNVFEAPVSKLPTLPISGYDIANRSDLKQETKVNDDYYRCYDYYPNGANTAGQYKDEADNTYNTTVSTTDGSHPTALVRGALDGKYRVHIVYRYWLTNTKNAVDTSVVSTDGTIGYSYNPIGDGTNIVSSEVKLNGLADASTFQKAKDSAISYKSGAESKNNYYWKQFNMASATTSAWFSDYNVTSTANRGTVFKSFVDATNNAAGAGAASPIYIFVDYYKVDPTSVVLAAGTNNTATTTYTGDAIKASALNLTIKDSVTQENYTGEYNIDFTDSSKIPVSYTWTGTNEAGNAENGTGALPTNAGTYTVTVNLADDTNYDPNDCDPAKHKNRNAAEYTFTLVIEQANALRGNLPDNIEFVYGNQLRDKLALNTYAAKGVKNEDVTGNFSFANGSDSTAYKTVGQSYVVMTWQPVYTSSATAKNYKETSFYVYYTVTPASLVISPNNAEVVYGNTDFVTPYSISLSGLVGNDDNDSVKADIAAAINYMVLVNSNYVAYSPDDVGAGEYNIRARVNAASAPAVLQNYSYSYADLVSGYDINTLKVSKRGLTVKASATSRGYAPENYSVNVSYTITDGKYSVDDVRFTSGTGALSVNNAGVREVSGVTKTSATDNMTGGASANYYIAELIYDTGSTLTVEITKAVPDVATPSVADVFYRRTATLADISINTASTSVPGNWTWEDPTINPTVAVTSYVAKFVPDDSVNYDVKTVSVNFTVKPSAVTVTYNGTVEYGDPVPNITAYTYSSVQDPSFSINSVVTSGNITPSTTYVQGAAVNADGYPVTISAPNYKDVDGNYIFTATNGKITVVPRNIEFTVQDASIVYGDNFTATASTVTLTHDESRFVGADTLNSITSDGSDPVFSYTTTFRYQDNYSVGTYEIKATPSFNTSANYTVSVKNGTLTVTKAPLTIKANNLTLAYNSDVPSNLATAYTFVGAKRNENVNSIVTTGSIIVDTNYEKGSPVNAEGYPLVVDVSGASFKNYSVTVENGKITVNKATPVITAYPTAAITYGESLADAVFEGAVIRDDVVGTFVYGSGSTVPAYSSDPYTIYTATFVPADTQNYNTVTGLYIPLTVNKMSITGALAVTGIPMNGETLTVDVSGLNPDELGVYTFAWSIDGAQVGTGSTFELAEAYVGKTVKVTATAQGYYEGTVEYTTTEIAPILTSVAEILGPTNFAEYFDLTGLDAFGETKNVTYDASNHPVNITLKSSKLSGVVIGSVVVKYNGSTDIPVNAGTYNVTVDVTTPDLSRVNETGVVTYSPASNLSVGTLVIAPKDYYVTVTIADKVYDGMNTAEAEDIEESGAVVLAGGVLDDVSFDAENAVYTFADANVGTGKTAAIGTAALTGSQKNNYKLIVALANDGKADITPRTLKVKVDPIEREYQENYYDIDLAFVVDVTTIAPADTSASVYVNEALAQGKADDFHAGKRKVTVSNVELAGNKASNYVLELTNIKDLTVEIEKATPDYPLPSTGTVYYDSGRTLSNISLGDKRWAWDSACANEIPEAGSHVYTAVYTPDDTANFAAVTYEVPLEVRKTPVVVKAASFTVTYGDAEPTYYYTLTGLTGADTKNDLGGYIIQNCAYTAGTDIGSYSIVLAGGFTSPNYTFTYVPGTVTVNERTVYVTVEPVSREYEEGNLSIDVNFSALSNIFEGDNANVRLASTNVKGSVESDTAGFKAVKYDLPALAGSKANNYILKALNPDVKAEIEKAHLPGIVLPISGEVDYGQRLSTTVFTSSYEGEALGSFSMENPMSTPDAVGTFSDVYKVVFTPFSSMNYATESAYIKLTVKTHKLELEMAVTGTLQVESKVWVVTSGIPAEAAPYIVYSWYRLNDPDQDIRSGVCVSSGSPEYVLKEDDAGKYIVCSAVSRSGSPYDIDAKAVSSKPIEEQALSFWQKIVKWFYRVIASITQLFGKISG